MKIYCENCRQERESDIRFHPNSIFKVKNQKVSVEIEKRYCLTCYGVVYDEKISNQNIEKIHLAYMKKCDYNPNDIKKMRKKMNMSQYLFSRLLNIGIATIQRYEKGSIPNHGHMLLLKKVKMNPKEELMKCFEKIENEFSNSERTFVYNAIIHYDDADYDNLSDYALDSEVLYSIHAPFNYQIESGCIAFDLDKFENMILYFLNWQLSLSPLDLGYLLWKSDYEHFKEMTLSISGTVYQKKISLFSYVEPLEFRMMLYHLQRKELIQIDESINTEGGFYELISTNQIYKRTLFTDEELEIMASVRMEFEKEKRSKDWSFASRFSFEGIIPYGGGETNFTENKRIEINLERR